MPGDRQHRRKSALKQGRYSFELLLEGRIWLFVTAELVVLFHGLFAALLSTGELAELYRSMVIVPLLILGVPSLASAVALERRAGSLDLALAVPSTELYFLRRVAPVTIFLIVQAWLLTFLAELIVLEGRFLGFLLSRKVAATVPLLLHATEVGLLVAAVTLFWASRIATTGGAMVASFATIGALYKWIFASPILATGPSSTWVLGVLPPAVIELVWNLTVLALATILFYLYARERLRRPEVMLA